MPIGLNHSQAAAYKGDLYVFGGYRPGNRATNRLFRYRPARDRWKRLADAPTARAAHALGVIGHRLYAAGGARNGRVLDTLEIYDFRTKQWSRGPSMSLAREHLAGAVAGGRFYALAGRAAGQGNFAVAERYNPRRNRWEALPDMEKARGGTAAAAVRGRIVIFGGEESRGTIREVELYHPGQRRWTSLPPMRTPRHGLGGVSRGNRVYAIEGGALPGFAFSDTIEFLDVP
jgi:hypothetical protein